MKKRSVIISVMALVALLVAGGTMAWFTSNPAMVTNEFKAGTVDITLNVEEPTTYTDINPGDTKDKKITVTSTGSKQTYVRVKLTPSWHMGFNVNQVLGPADYQIGDEWVEGDDGWYYYKHIMVDGETHPLIKKVEFIGDDMGNKYQGKTFKLGVKAEAVQASNDAYQTVWGLDSLPDGVDEWTKSES